MNFRESYCNHFGCAEEDYERKAFWRCLPRRAVPLASVINWWKPDYFQVDLDLLKRLGNLQDSRQFRSEINFYHFRCSQNPSFLRQFFRLRISGRRLSRLQKRLMPSSGNTAESEPDDVVPD